MELCRRQNAGKKAYHKRSHDLLSIYVAYHSDSVGLMGCDYHKLAHLPLPILCVFFFFFSFFREIDQILVQKTVIILDSSFATSSATMSSLTVFSVEKLGLAGNPVR